MKEFFASDPLPIFVGGEWVPAKSGQTFATFDPGTGETLTTVASGEVEDVNAAVRAARRAWEKSGWSTMAANDRAVILHRLADLVGRHREILAQIESLDVGKPFRQAMGNDVPNAAQTIRYHADLS